MRRIASILVSGKLALHANSERHLTASWKESMVAEKYFSKMVAGQVKGERFFHFWFLGMSAYDEYHRGCPETQTKNTNTNTDKHKEINI